MRDMRVPIWRLISTSLSRPRAVEFTKTQLSTRHPPLAGDPRITVGSGSGAVELGGSADGTEMTFASTAIDPTNVNTSAKTAVGTAAETRRADRLAAPDVSLASGREQYVNVVRRGGI